MHVRVPHDRIWETIASNLTHNVIIKIIIEIGNITANTLALNVTITFIIATAFLIEILTDTRLVERGLIGLIKRILDKFSCRVAFEEPVTPRRQS